MLLSPSVAEAWVTVFINICLEIFIFKDDAARNFICSL